MSRSAILVALLTIVALGLRVAGALDPPWLDEIWSLERAVTAPSWVGVFTSIHSDNNHWLVSLWLRACGLDASAVVLRLPAILLGSATVPLAYLVGRQRGGPVASSAEAVGVVAAALVALSYPFVHYGSEARGYAPAICFALLAAWLLERYSTHGRRLDGLGFAAAATAGCLAHLTFLFVLGALAIDVVARGGAPGKTSRPRVLALFAVPGLALGALFVVDLRYWTVAGGEDLPAWQGLAEATAWVLGLPPSGGTAIAAAALMLGAAAFSSRRACDVTAFSLPLLAATLSGAAFVPPRYFIVPLVFPLLATAGLAVHTWSRGGAYRAAALLAAAAFLFHQTFFLREFLEHGRGPTPGVIEAMLESADADGREPTVGLDFPTRGEPVLRYHLGRVERGAAVRIVIPAPERAPPTFLLHHVFGGGPEVGDVISGPGDRIYVLEGRYEHFGLSGWTWLLYRRAE